MKELKDGTVVAVNNFDGTTFYGVLFSVFSDGLNKFILTLRGNKLVVFKADDFLFSEAHDTLNISKYRALFENKSAMEAAYSLAANLIAEDKETLDSIINSLFHQALADKRSSRKHEIETKVEAALEKFKESERAPSIDPVYTPNIKDLDPESQTAINNMIEAFDKEKERRIKEITESFEAEKQKKINEMIESGKEAKKEKELLDKAQKYIDINFPIEDKGLRSFLIDAFIGGAKSAY